LISDFLFSAVLNYNGDIFENPHIINFVFEREINKDYIESILNICDTNFKPYIIEMNYEILGAISIV
jgi:hypothetical protein